MRRDPSSADYQANRTLGVLSKMFNLAELQGLCPDGSNPCLHVKRFREDKRARFLSTEEFNRLGRVLDGMSADGSKTRSASALRIPGGASGRARASTTCASMISVTASPPVPWRSARACP